MPHCMEPAGAYVFSAHHRGGSVGWRVTAVQHMARRRAWVCGARCQEDAHPRNRPFVVASGLNVIAACV